MGGDFRRMGEEERKWKGRWRWDFLSGGGLD